MPKRIRAGLLVFISLVLVLLGGSVLILLRQNRNKEVAACQLPQQAQLTTITTGDLQLTAEVTRTGAERQKGLSGRECLPDYAAMLFSYDRPGDYCFWMKDMHFPIDMIWLDDEKKVVTIKHRVAPESYPETFCPERPAQHIIEVQAGLANQAGWQTGTKFEF